MKSRKRWIVGLCLAYGVAGLAWFYWHQANGRTRSRMIRLQMEDAKLLRWPNPSVVLSPANATFSHSGSAGANEGKDVFAKAAPNISDFRLKVFFAHPELQAMFLSARKEALVAQYGSFIRGHALSESQTSSLEALLMRRETQALDVIASDPSDPILRALRGAGQSTLDPASYSFAGLSPQVEGVAGPSDPAGELLRQNDMAFAAEATALLGADGFQQLQDYERALSVVPLVANVAGLLSGGSDALSDAQTQRLTQLIAQSSGSYRNGDTVQLGSINWDAVLTKAPAFLTPGQMNALQTNNARTIEMRRFSALLRQAGTPQK